MSTPEKDEKTNPATTAPETSKIVRSLPEEKPVRFLEPHKIVTLLVGKDSTPFIVHHEIACQQSPVFKAAFESNVVEGQTQTYRLEENTVGAVRFLVQWLYSQSIDVGQLGGKELKSSEVTNEDHSLAELWVLADKLLLPHLENLSVQMIEGVRNKTSRIAVSTLKYIWEHTASDSPLRRLMLDQCLMLKPATYTLYSSSYPQEMLIQLVGLLLGEGGFVKVQKCKAKKRDMKDFEVPA